MREFKTPIVTDQDVITAFRIKRLGTAIKVDVVVAKAAKIQSLSSRIDLVTATIGR